ncbi:S-layer homology domain-containing protein [Paenibacillus sp. PK4536]|uniref:S-layer homology domain-containing protein n=1 Tax=Paenibacillus sp. PK4536 TaxID=3024576 RepID=UPI002358887B|nr:S-layer homology domain-containing protein [Paenibacillus sp. PK4536]WIM39423.1 S-layer homology domain-containing protein [Paenibacillus sp. PK4536]
MKKLIVSVLATSIVCAGITYSEPLLHSSTASQPHSVAYAASSSGNFKDVKGHWAEATIAKAYAMGLVQGYQDGTFRPNAKVTRAEYASLLTRATKLGSGTGGSSFKDMKGHWAENAVTRLSALGFINNSDYSNGFKPNTELTRLEMMKWMSNGLVQSNISFKQAFEDTQNTLLPTPEATKGKIAKSQIPYLALVRGTGIVGGFADGSLQPEEPTTRAEVAAILLRYIDIEGQEASKYADLNEMREVGTTGTNLLTISNYKYTEGDFGKIMDAKMTLSNKSASLKLHHYIVIDARNSKPRSVYSDLFIDPQKGLKSYQKGLFLTYADITFTSNIEYAISNMNTFNNGLTNGVIRINRISDFDYIKKMGINTISMNSSNFDTKGKTTTFWTESNINASGVGYSLKVDDGTKVQFEN